MQYALFLLDMWRKDDDDDDDGGDDDDDLAKTDEVLVKTWKARGCVCASSQHCNWRSLANIKLE